MNLISQYEIYIKKHFSIGGFKYNNVWRNINNDRDVIEIFDLCKGKIKLTYHIFDKGNLIIEDIEQVEKAIGEVEIALRRIKTFPQYFTFTENEISELKAKHDSFVADKDDLEIKIHNQDL